MNKKIALLLALSLCMGLLSSCSPSVVRAEKKDLMAGIKPSVNTETAGLNAESALPATEFAVKLFKKSLDSEKSTLVSPVSVLYALAMTANGADGNTLKQMEDVLGMKIDDLNTFLNAYMKTLPKGDLYKVDIANSIWINNSVGFKPKDEFLQTNADYYGASIYDAPFDETTLKDVNDWVSEHTDGMIKNILDDISSDSLMFLVNALTFDAEWKEIYRDYQIEDGEFTKADGSKVEVPFMHNDEYLYISDDKASGFIKPYADWKYAFVALLPNEGISVEDYVASLDGEKLAAMLANPSNEEVITAIPKFKAEFSIDMSEMLAAMGMEDAFNPNAADLSKMGEVTGERLFIGKVIHKTFIEVNERGTKAGAATLVDIECTAMLVEEPPKEVVLDRPFIYMIVDTNTNTPIFMGTMLSPEK